MKKDQHKEGDTPSSLKDKLNNIKQGEGVKEYIVWVILSEVGKWLWRSFKKFLFPASTDKKDTKDSVKPTKVISDNTNSTSSEDSSESNKWDTLHISHNSSYTIADAEDNWRQLAQIQLLLDAYDLQIEQLCHNTEPHALTGTDISQLDNILSTFTLNNPDEKAKWYRTALKGNTSKGLVCKEALLKANNCNRNTSPRIASIDTLAQHPVFDNIETILGQVGLWQPTNLPEPLIQVIKDATTIKFNTWNEFFHIVVDLWAIYYYGYLVIKQNAAFDKEGLDILKFIINRGFEAYELKIATEAKVQATYDSTLRLMFKQNKQTLIQYNKIFTNKHSRQVLSDLNSITTVWNAKVVFPSFMDKTINTLTILNQAMLETWRNIQQLADVRYLYPLTGMYYNKKEIQFNIQTSKQSPT